MKLIKELVKKNKKWKRFMKVYISLRNNLFFESLLGLFIGAYFEFLISGIYAYQFG